MPWIHFHVGDGGMAKACCVAQIPFGNVNEDSFDAIWNGPAIQALRKKFTAGTSDPRCAVCLKREKAGASSIRTETFEKFGHQIPMDTTYPRYFDIRFSNVCNFRCRTCWHGASSKWFKDAKILKRQVSETAIINNIKDFEVFIQEYGAALMFAEEIYFAGGEPLVTTEHYLLLEWLIDKQVYPRLRYNTNFSVLSFKNWDVIELWSHFKEVELMASIDAHEGLGEYIRKELNWSTFLTNHIRLRKELPHIEFKIAPTISIMNVEFLPEFYDHCLKHRLMDAKNWYINLLERPIYYNIRALPIEKKMSINKAYNEWIIIARKKEYPSAIINMFMDVLSFMNSEDLSKYYLKYQEETLKLDEIRNEHNPSSVSS